MSDETSVEEATRIYARGGVAGFCWGAKIGVVFLALMVHANLGLSDLLEFVPFALLAGLVGGVVGGVVGLVNGLVLSAREDGARHSDLDRRVTAFVTSAALLGGASLLLTGGHLGLPWAVVTVAGAVAGALLAPGVVKGTRGRRVWPV